MQPWVGEGRATTKARVDPRSLPAVAGYSNPKTRGWGAVKKEEEVLEKRRTFAEQGSGDIVMRNDQQKAIRVDWRNFEGTLVL